MCLFYKQDGPSGPRWRRIVDTIKRIRLVVMQWCWWPFVLLAVGVVVSVSWWKKRREAKLKQAEAELSSE